MKRALLVLALAGDAAADPCEDHIDDPIALPWREAGLDAHRAGCLRSDVSLDLGGRALVDTPEFYGTLGGGGSLSARVSEEHFEWGLGMRMVDVTYVQNAVLKVTEIGYGPVFGQLALGTGASLGGRPLAAAAYLRLELPYTRSRLDGSSGGAQVGAAVTWALGDRVRLHGRAALLGWYAASTAGSDTRGALALSADASWRLIAWLTATGGLDLQGGWYGAGVDHVAVRAGVHWRITSVWRAALAAGLPVVGADRTDAAVTLGIRRDLD